MIPPILTEEEAEALSRGWRRLGHGQGWEIPALLLQPVAAGPGGKFRAANHFGVYDFVGSEADCLAIALRNWRYREPTPENNHPAR